jgi:hypothetical protein
VKNGEEGNLRKGKKIGGWKESRWNVRCTGKVGALAFVERIVWAQEKKNGRVGCEERRRREHVPKRNR